MSGWIPPFEYMNTLVASGTVTSGSATGGPIPLGHDGITSMSFQNLWNQLAADGQTVATTLVVEASNTPNAFSDPSNADWENITSQLTITQPTSGAGSDLVQISNVTFMFIRIRMTSITGSGRFRSTFTGRSG